MATKSPVFVKLDMSKLLAFDQLVETCAGHAPDSRIGLKPTAPSSRIGGKVGGKTCFANRDD